MKPKPEHYSLPIQVIIPKPRSNELRERRKPTRILINTEELAVTDDESNTATDHSFAPPLYVLNAAALSKPGAIEHLAADLNSYGITVAVVTETHFKKKHTDSVISIEGYTGRTEMVTKAGA